MVGEAKVNKCGMYRCIVFTIFNYTDDDIESLKSNSDIKYLIYGKETCPKTGTPHLQGYLELNGSYRFNRIKSINDKMHFEGRKGSQKQAIDYCKKDGEWTEYGVVKTQGDRTDLKKQREDIKSGMKLKDLVEEYDLSPNQCKAIKEYYNLYEPSRSRSDKMKVYWCYGPTGAGKTKWVHDLYEDDLYVKDCNSKWWDGYDCQETVLFDDIRPHSFPFNWLLNITDVYPMQVEIKGGYRQFRSKRIVFTCPMHPDEYFNKMMNAAEVGEDINQLLRRITEIKYFDGTNTEAKASKCNPFKIIKVKHEAEVRRVTLEPTDFAKCSESAAESLDQNLKQRINLIESLQMSYQQEVRNLMFNTNKTLKKVCNHLEIE